MTRWRIKIVYEPQLEEGDNQMSKHLKVVLCTLSLLTGPVELARAQVTIDMSKITCRQFLESYETQAVAVAVWMSGYFNGKQGVTVIDPDKFDANATKVETYCRSNPGSTLMQAAETVLAAAK